jgi:predicted amidophosphoribosyltransferase
MAEVMGLPIITNAVTRLSSAGTQTHRNRIERWQHMEGKFRLVCPAAVAGRHLLLVDDVMTTGATIDICARALLQAEGVRVSIVALAWADS